MSVKSKLGLLLISFFIYAPAAISQVQDRHVYRGSEKPEYSANNQAAEVYIPKKNGFNLSQSVRDIWDQCERYQIINHLDAAITLGTTGIGLELATPVTKWTRLRVGFDWMPSFKLPMLFDINTYSDGLPSNNFNKVQEMLYNLTGIEMDDKIKMYGKPTFNNFKLLVDVFPFQNNRHWHFTAGFFIGNTQIAKAYNSLDEKPTLVGLNIYNRAYTYFTHVTDIFDVPTGGGNYLDPDLVEQLIARFNQYGRMGVHMGDFKDGTPYIMEPASDGTVGAKAYANRFRPYLGFGYSGNLDPLGKWQIGFEAGAMFWGGVPDVINQDGVNMTKDLINIRGKVGTYIGIIRALPVYPVINLRISYNIL